MGVTDRVQEAEAPNDFDAVGDCVMLLVIDTAAEKDRDEVKLLL